LLATVKLLPEKEKRPFADIRDEFKSAFMWISEYKL